MQFYDVFEILALIPLMATTHSTLEAQCLIAFLSFSSNEGRIEIAICNC